MGTTSKLKTMRRDWLLRKAKDGKLVAVSGYNFDDMTGEDRWSGNKPVRVMCSGPDRYKPDDSNFYLVGEWDFQTKTGSAWKTEGSDIIHLHVHSNASHDFKVV